MTKLLTRRDFLKGSAGLVIGSAVGLPAQTAPNSRVVLIRHPEAVEAGSRFNAEVIQQMLDEAIVASAPPLSYRVGEPLKLEIEDFLLSTEGKTQPQVTGEAGVRALRVVARIVEDIESRLKMWST